MGLRIYNTLIREKEDFEPVEPGKVKMYVCGVTVYDMCHIGHARSIVLFDVIYRYLMSRGYEVTYVRNFTDVDDKTIAGANAAGIPLQEYTQKYIDAFYEDCDSLSLERVEHYPRATDPEHIEAMVELVSKLRERGHTYDADGSVYYKISTFPSYGKLSRVDMSGMKAGARVEADDYAKKDVRDFVLWKGPKPGEPSWETRVGRGRPGDVDHRSAGVGQTGVRHVPGDTIHRLRPGAHRATWVRDNLPVTVGQRPDATDSLLSSRVKGDLLWASKVGRAGY